jgi:plastocyanin
VRRGFFIVLALVLLAPAVAWADKQIDATPGNRFSGDSYTMDQGEKLVFHNGDTVTHDVTASQKGPDGKPLFSSGSVDGGKSAPVDGSQYLTEGHYEFVCTIHPNMKAMLMVTGNGTPAQRPGGSGAANTPAGAKDTKAPDLGLRIVSRGVRIARTRHALTVRLTLSESAHVMLKAVARPKVNGRLVTIAKTEKHLAAGTSRVRVKLTRAGRAALRGKRHLAVIVTGRAMDAAGNDTTEVHGKTLGR